MLLQKFLRSKSGLITLNKYLFARNLKSKQPISVQINDNLSENPKKSKEPVFQSQNPLRKLKTNEIDLSSVRIPNNRDKNPKKSKNIVTLSENSKINEEKAETLENLLKSFAENKADFEMTFYLKFLKESLRCKKNKTTRDIDLKRNVYSDLLKIPQIIECISTLKSHLNDMQSHEITSFFSILSKMDYYEADIHSYISNRVIRKEVELNTISTSYLIWSLAKYRIKNEELVDSLVKSLLKQLSVILRK